MPRIDTAAMTPHLWKTDVTPFSLATNAGLSIIVLRIDAAAMTLLLWKTDVTPFSLAADAGLSIIVLDPISDLA